jgi:predicted CxxxxCH...CXXCH cytochrome family protein
MKMRLNLDYGGFLAMLLVSLGIALSCGGVAQAAPQYDYDCTLCHTMPPRDSGTAKKNPFTGGIPGRHQTHADSTVNSCAKCHGDGVTGYTTAHRDKVIQFRDAIGYGRKPADPAFMNQTSVPPNPLATCVAAVCHSNGKGVKRETPAWSSAAAASCDTCHDSQPTTNKHSKHVSSVSGYGFGCVKCHSDHQSDVKPFQHATSAGGRNIDVHFTAAPNSGGSFGSDQCSNLYCHSDGRGNTKTVSWSGAGLDCKGCHGDATTDTLSGKHAKHVNNAAFLGTSYGCVKCHTATVSDNTTIADTAKHVDGVKDVTAACSSCHQDGKGTDKSVGLDWNGATTLDCKGCHGADAAPAFASVAGEPNYANTTPGDIRANSHKKHVTSAADCVKCHSTTTADGLTIKAGSPHTDGTINVVADGTLANFTPGANKTCSNISCHSGGGILTSVQPAQWGATLDCQGCHSTLSAGHIAAHTAYGCVTCHSDTVTDNTTIKAAGAHMNSAINVAGTAITSFTLATQTCAASCHLSASPQWNVPASGQCGSCHNVTSPLIASGAHSVHFDTTRGPGMAQSVAGCQVCHNYASETAHVNGTKDMNSGFAANGTCSTCHTRVTTQWTMAASVTCESCHTTTGGALSTIGSTTAPDKTAAATSGHGQAGIAMGCTACHDTASRHITGTLGDDTRLLAALGTGNTNCTYCHNDPAKVANADKRITQGHAGSAGLCSACHDPHGAGNSNMVKGSLNSVPVSFNGSNFVNAQGTGVCQACHTGTAYYKQNVAETNHYDSSTNCLECHTHMGADNLTAFEPNRACDSCHGYPPAPRSTAYAVTFGVQGNWSSARFEDYSGGGGAHVVAAHLAKSIKPSDGFEPCKVCHFDAAANHYKAMPLRNHVENVTVKVDPQFRFSDETFITYTGAKLISGGTNKTGGCFNVSCHIQTSNKWSTER